jgi:hypothetical protein
MESKSLQPELFAESIPVVHNKSDDSMSVRMKTNSKPEIVQEVEPEQSRLIEITTFRFWQ